MRVDAAKKRLYYREGGDGQIMGIDYDALINSSPIDQFVEKSQICAPPRLDHNKVKNNF
jgi:hypothetical protein